MNQTQKLVFAYIGIQSTRFEFVEIEKGSSKRFFEVCIIYIFNIIKGFSLLLQWLYSLQFQYVFFTKCDN